MSSPRQLWPGDDAQSAPVWLRPPQEGHAAPEKMYPEKAFNQVLFATCYTRHLNRYGYLRFQHWKFYGGFGLADKPVTVWVRGNLEVGYRATTLAEYDVKLPEDHRRVREVSHPRLADTHFRFP